ncbi:MAG: methyltransferase domain-containing protein [Candidatus Omnitrophica bacterium]|nr:methyltransferase domain-containing protein [Candidatus Omnitrophota bacterium]
MSKKNRFRDVYPPYLPPFYFLLLKLRKSYRQRMTRFTEERVRRSGPVHIVADGDGEWTVPVNGLIPNPVQHINRSALWMDEDLNLPEIKAIIKEINDIKQTLTSRGLKFTSTAASFIPRMYTEYSEKKNAWENAWCFLHSKVKPTDKVLDIGGSSTAFNFYLASLGCKVSSVDNDWNNYGINYNTNYVGKKMGWNIRAYDIDGGKRLPFPDNHFDRIFSICVIEHLTSKARRGLMKELGRVIKPGGIASFSTDYDPQREVLVFDKGLRFAYRKKFEEDVINPSGLVLHGNQTLIDAYPDQNFLGAFFLKKREKNAF